MASDGATGGGGPLPLDLLDRGDPAFVDALRGVHDADALAEFAGAWYDDRRPDSRRLLLDYLDRPLNAYRHEGLVKRLFKRAEAAEDDEVMARFLVLFDRSIRRAVRRRYRRVSEVVATFEEANELKRAWAKLGDNFAHHWESMGRFNVWGNLPEPYITLPRRTTMPRGELVESNIRRWPDVLKKLEGLRLFRVATRDYLRRRAWRYFRKRGRARPDLYVAAASEALALYRDEDVADGLALLDNWGLVHILFHHGPSLLAKPSGWSVRPGRSLADLAPAPIFEPLWDAAPEALVRLLGRARCRVVRRWLIRRIEADPAKARASVPAEDWFALLGHGDPEVVGLAAGMLREAEGLEALDVSRWLALVESTPPEALEVVCDLIARHVRPDRATVEQAARLASLRRLPAARLGLSWLRAKAPGAADGPTLLGLLDAGCGPLRPEILRWLRGALGAWPGAILAFLDGRHADARAEGWAWLRSQPGASDDVETWRRLLESPYDDVRLALVADLEARALGGEPCPIERALGTDDLARLWAAVLLNVDRGSRARPGVVRQLLRRLEARPDDAPALLPLLGVALRSVRGPERRAGLVAVVKLVESRAEAEAPVRSAFPELQWG